MATITKDEPVLSVASVGSVISTVLTVLVTHGVLTATQASTLTQTLAPLGAAAAPILLGLIARKFVAPWGKVRDAVEKSGLMSDADFARLEALLDDRLAEMFLGNGGSVDLTGLVVSTDGSVSDTLYATATAEPAAVELTADYPSAGAGAPSRAGAHAAVEPGDTDGA